MTPIEFKYLLIYSLIFSFIFLIAEVIYRVFKPDSEYTRKFVHITSGFISLSFTHFFNTVWPILIICGLFVIILAISKKYHFLDSINDINRKSVGSILYPIAILMAFTFFSLTGKPDYYYIPLVIMFVSDPLAALAGRIYPIKIFRIEVEIKSLGGSIVFFLSALAILIIFMLTDKFHLTASLVFHLILIAVASTITEALSRKGTDNILIPLVVITMLFILGIP